MNDISDENRGNSSAELILNALTSEFRAKRDRAVAQLSVYMKSHVGVAEHSNIVDDCSELVKQIAEAEESLRVVNTLFVPVNPESTIQNS